jgi:hypothetical protein
MHRNTETCGAVIEIGVTILGRVELDGDAVFLEGQIEVTPAHEDVAAIIVRRGKIRAQLHA